MSFDEFEMVNTAIIAHGLIHLATTEPESAFSMGLSVLRKNKKIIKKINKNNQSNIINFLDYKK